MQSAVAMLARSIVAEIANMIEHHNDARLPAPSFPGSHMVIDDGYVFLSGLVAADVEGGAECIGDVAAETDLVMRELRRLLESVGCTMESVVRVDVHLADLDEITAMDAVYATFFAADRYPARTCTESPRLCGASRVEITLLARRPSV